MKMMKYIVNLYASACLYLMIWSSARLGFLVCVVYRGEEESDEVAALHFATSENNLLKSMTTYLKESGE